MKQPRNTAFPSCIYTIALADELDRCIRDRDGTGFLDEGKHWATGRQMLMEARRNGQFVPLLLANAARIDGVQWLAVIENIELLPNGHTRILYRSLHRLPKPIPLHRLVVEKTGKPLSGSFIRPYAICRTPAATLKSLQRWAKKSSWYSVQDYINAFRKIEQRMNSGQRAMLLNHYAASSRRLSEAKLAKIAGYATGDAANLQYGKLGGLVAKALGYKPTRAATWSLAQWDGFPDENGHGEWVLRHEVATALEELGWVRPDRIGEKAEAARRQILEKDPELAAESPTTRKALIDARSGQGRFRESVVRYWGGCAVTGCVDADLLVASHIVPWAGATNQERLDPFNGLLLIPALDVLFDRHLISFTDKGAMLISAMLKNDTRRIFGLTAKLKLRRLDDRHLPYLARHRERFFELQK